MPFYTFDTYSKTRAMNTRSVFFHPVQNVLLVSDFFIENIEIDQIIEKISAKKEEYNILDLTLNFDVFIRKGPRLLHRAYTFDGKKNLGLSEKTPHEEGFFYVQLARPFTRQERFEIEGRDYTLQTITLNEFHTLGGAERGLFLDELVQFIRIHFEEHFTLWGLSLENLKDETTLQNFSSIMSATSSLYFVRDNNGKLVATMGMSHTLDCELAYLSLIVTHRELRERGIMAFMLTQMSFDYSTCVMTGYIVSPILRNLLGEKAMIKQNALNALSDERFSFSNSSVDRQACYFIP